MTCPSEREYRLRKKTETQCTKQPQFAAPAISPVTHECSISAKLHYVAGTTGVEVSHPALTCVLQLYERASASATNFPMQGKTGILRAFSRVRENSWLPQIIAYNMVSCYTEFVLTVAKGENLQWKHDITAKETLTTY